MADLRVRRTLVKSPPELWAELSEVEGLERHLGEFGEIRITRAQPESTVAWEGESASGVVELEPTGWGTKVTITAEVPEEEPPAPEPRTRPHAPDPGLQEEPRASGESPEHTAVGTGEADLAPAPVGREPEPVDPEPEPEPVEAVALVEPAPKRRGFFARWLFRERRDSAPTRPETGPAALPEAPGPQLPAEPEPVVAAEPAPLPPDDDDFEFDFEVRRGTDEDASPAPPEPEPIGPERAREVLEEALESLGQAHHRPFSRG